MIAKEIKAVAISLSAALSPIDSCPVTPCGGIVIPGSTEVSPCSLDGRHAAEALEI